MEGVPELKSTQDIDKYADFIVTAISPAVDKAISSFKSGLHESHPVSEESLAQIKEKRRFRRQNEYFYPPEDPDDYKSDMHDDHDLVTDIDADTLIRIVNFLNLGKAPGPDNLHNEVLRLGTTTSLFHYLARLFTSSIQIGYIPIAWKLATLRMLLKPDKLPSLTTSYRPISLMSSIMKLFE